jgi:hypothetical protein
MSRFLLILAFSLLPALAMLGCDDSDFEMKTPAGDVEIDVDD